jgi:RNA polymerase sigma-70 factor (ECF subfamily)
VEPVVAEETITRESAAVAAAGGEMPFEAFYASTAPALAAFIRRVSGNRSAAEDVLQETYLRFLRARHAGRALTEMRSYLYRTATTILYDQWRRPQREERELDPRHAIDEHAADPALRADMARAFTQLVPRERALLWLAYVEGLDHAEIAASLGLSRISVRVLLFRARAKLARILRANGFEKGVVS